MAKTNATTISWLRSLTADLPYEFKEEVITKKLTKREFAVLKYIEDHPHGLTATKIRRQLNLQYESTCIGIIVKLIYLDKVFIQFRSWRANKLQEIVFLRQLPWLHKSGKVSKIFPRNIVSREKFNCPVDLYKLL